MTDPVRYPLPSGTPLYTERFIEALQAAARMHRAQDRKGTGVPYISHLMGTCAIAQEYGANEDQAIAALLHDAIEDIEPIRSWSSGKSTSSRRLDIASWHDGPVDKVLFTLKVRQWQGVIPAGTP